MDNFLLSSGGKQPTMQILDLWATQFNSEFGDVPGYGVTLYQKKKEDEENLSWMEGVASSHRPWI